MGVDGMDLEVEVESKVYEGQRWLGYQIELYEMVVQVEQVEWREYVDVSTKDPHQCLKIWDQEE